MKLATLLLLAGCASIPAPPPATSQPEIVRPVIIGAAGESSRHFLARLLVDACTDEPTDEIQIQHAELLLGACHANYATCMRRVCAAIARTDAEPATAHGRPAPETLRPGALRHRESESEPPPKQMEAIERGAAGRLPTTGRSV